MRARIELKRFAIALIILNALGFPGSYSIILGDFVCEAFNYFCFFLQIILIFTSTGGFKITIEKKHWMLYFFVLWICLTSILMAGNTLEIYISLIRLVVLVLFSLWLVRNLELNEVLKIFCKQQFVFILLTILFVVLKPQYSFENTTGAIHAFTGLYNSKNNCAGELSCGIVVTLLYAKYYTKEIRWYFLCGVQFLLLIMCQALGGLMTCIVALVWIIFCYKWKWNVAKIYILGNIVFCTLFLLVLPTAFAHLSFWGKGISLTGRTEIWNNIIILLRDSGIHSLLGWGYFMFWKTPEAYQSLQHLFANQYGFWANQTAGSHNAMIEMLLDGGILGVVCYFLLIYWAFKNTHRTNERYIFVSSIIIFIMLFGFTERFFSPFDYKMLLLFVAIGIAKNGEMRNQKEIEI